MVLGWIFPLEMMGKLWSIALPWDEVGTGPWASS